jgi:GNAT superfamily N-acetyltransferase
LEIIIMPTIDPNLLSLIQYSPAEIDPLHDIVADCGEDMLRRYGLTHWVPPFPIETMRRNAKEHFVYGIHNGAEVIGTFTVSESGWKHDDRFWENPAHKPLYLSKLAIRPKYQGHGVGRWCIKEVEKIAHIWESQAIRFDAIARHDKLIQFYQNLGYLARGTQIVTDMYGRDWEIVYFEKILASD